MQRFTFRAMGSTILAVLDGEPLPASFEPVPHWFEEWEQVLSRFRVDSELSRFNAKAGSPQVVSETFWSVYQAAMEAHDETGGLVNSLVLQAMIHAGYDRSFDRLEAAAALDPEGADLSLGRVDSEAPLPPPLSSLVLDSATHTLCLPEGSGLDFGGVAKGWAAHQSAQRLKKVAPAIVSAGGDIALSGPRADGTEWQIGVEDPFGGSEYIEMIYLDGGGVATSGRDRKRWMRGGVMQHHVIDPRTGVPAQTDVLAATVIAPTVMKAEAMAKVVLVVGSVAGLQWLERDDTIAGMLVLESGQRLYSHRFEKYL